MARIAASGVFSHELLAIFSDSAKAVALGEASAAFRALSVSVLVTKGKCDEDVEQVVGTLASTRSLAMALIALR